MPQVREVSIGNTGALLTHTHPGHYPKRDLRTTEGTTKDAEAMKRSAYFFTFAVLLCGPLPGNAQESEIRLVSEQPSPLTRSVFVAPNETRFSGSAEVTGTVEIMWEPSYEGYPGYFRVALKPDVRSQKILPHEVRRGPVREIWLRNADTAVATLMTPAQKKAVSTGRQMFAAQATLIIRSYRTAVDCDTRAYNALLVSVVGPPPALSAMARPQEIPGC